MVDMAAIRRRYDEMQRKQRASSIWRPAEGENLIRIIPWTHKGVEFFYLQSAQHFYVRPDKVPVECRTGLLGEDCPICTRLEMDLEDPETGESELTRIKRMLARDVYYFNIFDWLAWEEWQKLSRSERSNETKPGCEIFPCPPGLARDIFQKIQNERLYPNFFDLEDGCDLYIQNSGEGFNRYTLDIPPQRTAVPKHVLGEAKNLFTYVKAPSEAWVEELITRNIRDIKDLKEEYRGVNRIEVLGDIDERPENWLLYYSPEESTKSAEGKAVNKGRKKKKDKGKSGLAALRSKMEGKEEGGGKKPKKEGFKRSPMTEDDEDVPRCCGTDETPGHWEEGCSDCIACVAEDVCRHFTEGHRTVTRIANETETKAEEDSPHLRGVQEPTPEESPLDRLRRFKRK